MYKVKIHFQKNLPRYPQGDGVIDIDDVLYVTDNSGALSKLNKTGWILVNNEYYYVSGNKLFTGGVYKIGGSYYGFDWSGKMYNNALFSIYKDGHSDTYYASNGGALVMNKNGTVKGSKYYFDANGKGYEGYHTIWRQGILLCCWQADDKLCILPQWQLLCS